MPKNYKTKNYKPKKQNKYGNKKTSRIINREEVKFDSLKEAGRFDKLYSLLKEEKISNLTLQPKFVLQEKFTDKSGNNHRAINYVADFKYIENGIEIIEDVKSEVTRKIPLYSVKKKLLLFKYPEINFIET